MKKTIKQGAVIKKKITQIFIYGKNTVSVRNIEMLEAHWRTE